MGVQTRQAMAGPVVALAGGDLMRGVGDAVPDVAGAWGALVLARDGDALDVVALHGDQDAGQGPATRVLRDGDGWRMARGWRWRRDGVALLAHPPG